MDIKLYTQIREQMSGPNLHVFILRFFALKKQGFFSLFQWQFFLSFFIKKGITQLFSADAIYNYFGPRKSEKLGLKSC